MSGTTTKSQAALPTDLERLVATERGLAERLAAARAEGRRIVAEAQASAETRERQTEAELEQAATTLRREIAEARDRAIVALREQAAREVARFTAVGDELIQRLAAHVLERVVRTERAP